jgi:hypothetical protein
MFEKFPRAETAAQSLGTSTNATSSISPSNGDRAKLESEAHPAGLAN